MLRLRRSKKNDGENDRKFVGENGGRNRGFKKRAPWNAVIPGCSAPLTLTRQRLGSNEFEIVWPENTCFKMGDHDSFFLRDGDKLYFSRWFEEGDGPDYKYRDTILIRDLSGNIIDEFPGDIRVMPNGEKWYLK